MITTRLHTVEELWTPVLEGGNFELIEGELFEVSPGKRKHGTTQLRLGSRILAFVDALGLGIASTEEGFILRRNPDTVLAPDVAFVSNARLGEEPERWSEVPPDLAVEVVSPSNRQSEIDRKTRIYLESGVRAVWIAYPERREVVVHEAGQTARVVSGAMQLEGGEVLPGFTVSMQEIFGK
ncbi:MAG: Uma2 family endonuclease [Thermomicrobiales bacterium]